MKQQFIRFFNEIDKSDVSTAGGKGASLGEMTQAGFPVPPGFVVLASAFDRFLRETDIYVEIEAQLRRVDAQKTHTVDDASQVIRQLIDRYGMPEYIEKEILAGYERLGAKYVAVRSSATAEDSNIASWAGELESYLGITKKDLISSLQKCWSSLFTPRAIFYRIEKGLDGKEILVAVVVQKMVEAEVAGVCFTTHPVTKDSNQMVIEASWGLGESVVAGRVTPDNYIVGKSQIPSNKFQTNSKFQISNSKQFRILDKNINIQETQIKRVGEKTKEVKMPKSKASKQCLPDNKIIELAKICHKIENHYNFPCDIEWAMEKGKIYIVQSRPITTLGPGPSPEKSEQPVLDPDEWHKLGNWTTYLLGAEFWFGRRFSEAYKKIVGSSPDGMFYFDGAESHQFFSKHTIENLKKQIKKETESKFFSRIRKEFYDNKFKLLELRNQFESLKQEDRLEFLVKKVFPLYVNNAVYDWIAFLHEQLYHDDVYKEYKRIRGTKIVHEFPVLVTPSIKTDNLKEQIAILKEALVAKKRKGKILITLARRLLREFGYLPIFQMGNPHSIDYYIKMLKEIVKEQSVQEIEKEVKQLEDYPQKIAISKKSLFNKTRLPVALKTKLDILSMCAEIRTFSDEFVSMVGMMFRRTFKGLADLHGIKYQDLYFLNSSEIIEAYKTKRVDKKIINERKKFFVAVSSTLNDLDIYSGKEAQSMVESFLTQPEEIEDSGIIEGFIAYPGKVQGQVHIVLGEKSKKTFKKGEILVAPATIVQYVPMMRKAGAIVTDYGGLTSHAAIVAREIRTPCIVGTKIATKVLKDGDLVEVDAEKGIVSILEKEKIDSKKLTTFG